MLRRVTSLLLLVIMKKIDNFRIDSHKLVFHPARVSAWLAGETVYPIYAEISPSGACNHRCTFCALDYLEYKPLFLDTGRVKNLLTEMGALGLKSVMYGGEGEPLLHRNLAEIIQHTKTVGIDAAITTNGVLLENSFCEKILDCTSWIKISLNAGTPGTYARIHQTREEDFGKVLTNLKQAIRLRQTHGHRCTIGAQMLLLPENAEEVEELAIKLRDIGLDYLVIKPYSQHLHSKTDIYRNLDYRQFLALRERLEILNTTTFSVIFRESTMRKLTSETRSYGCCLALPFWTYIDAGGTVWGCSAHLGDERFAYGSIYQQTFANIWEGKTRQKNLKLVATLDPNECRTNCRMDEVNRYLWELTNPHDHVNFI